MEIKLSAHNGSVSVTAVADDNTDNSGEIAAEMTENNTEMTQNLWGEIDGKGSLLERYLLSGVNSTAKARFWSAICFRGGSRKNTWLKRLMCSLIPLKTAIWQGNAFIRIIFIGARGCWRRKIMNVLKSTADEWSIITGWNVLKPNRFVKLFGCSLSPRCRFCIKLLLKNAILRLLKI